MSPAHPASTGPSPRVLLDASDVTRTIARMAHQIIEKTAVDSDDAPRVQIIGIPSRGPILAQRLADKIAEFSGVRPGVGFLDIRSTATTCAASPPPARADLGPRRRHRRCTRRPRRRRPLLGPDGPRGARRAARPRAPGRRAARGPRRPRPPGAADPRGLRRQEPPDRPHRGRRCPSSRQDGIDEVVITDGPRGARDGGRG